MNFIYTLIPFVTGVCLLCIALPTFRRGGLSLALLLKYTLILLVESLGIHSKARARLTWQRALRLYCEEMGVTYIKWGQIIASSSGIFPESLVQEFNHVLDNVRPFRFEVVRERIEEELGESAELLQGLSSEPIASASIAQVHSAALLDGSEVVVKVQRPGIKKQIAIDLKILNMWAQVLPWVVRSLRPFNLIGVVADLRRSLGEEIDFRAEAKNLEEFNEMMREHGQVLVRAPAPHWPLVTEKVLVMERFYGTRLDDAKGIAEDPMHAEASLIEGMVAWFRCMLLYGFFHGDMHAGNLMLLSDKKGLGFLDFGIVGRFDDKQRALITEYLIALASSDFKKVAALMVKMGGTDALENCDDLSESLSDIFKPLMSKTFSEIKYRAILPQLQAVAREYQMVIPKEFILVTKQILYFDRYAKLIAPKLNIFTDPRLVKSLLEDILKARESLVP